MNSKTRKLNRQNNLLDEQIRNENQEIFTNMISYLRSSDISEYEIELVRQDLTEMVLSAQKRGENITALFDGDYKQFCDDVMKNLSVKSPKERVAETLDLLCLELSILFAINIVISRDVVAIFTSLVKGVPVNWNISVSAGSLISIFLIMLLANVMVNQIMKNAFKKELRHERILVFVCGAGLIVGLIVIAWLGKRILFAINIFAACIVTVLLFLAHKVFERLGS